MKKVSFSKYSLKQLEHFERCAHKRLKCLGKEYAFAQERLCYLMQEVDKRRMEVTNGN